MSDDPKPDVSAPQALAERMLTETVQLKVAVDKAIGEAVDAQAAVQGSPVNPDVLCGLLLQSCGTIAMRWATTTGQHPLIVDEYFDKLLRRARRGFNMQLEAAVRSGALVKAKRQE